MGQRWPECDPRIRDWVEGIVERLCRELDDDLVGAYLHGSLASGAFYPPKSDVDLLLVTTDPLTPAARRAFAESCVDLSVDRPIVGGLECSVIRRRHATGAVHPVPFEVHFGEEWVTDIVADAVDYEVSRSDPDLTAHRQAVLEFGIPLAGQRVIDVFGPVDRSHFGESIEGDLEWILEGDQILESPFYGVLNSCRTLWLWRAHSDRLVPTKEEAALWALGVVPAHLRPIIEDALSAYRDDTAISPEERRTAGRIWDRSGLLVFRNWMRDRWENRRSGTGTSIQPGWDPWDSTSP